MATYFNALLARTPSGSAARPTSYIFRNHFVADLRRLNFSREEITRLMGNTKNDTEDAFYGHGDEE